MDWKLMRTYLRYIAPSTLAFVLAGVYAVVDGLFVGHAIGDAGLAAINLAYPLQALVLSAGTGIGLGGAVISSIRLGEADVNGSRQATAHTLALLALCAPVMMAVLLPSFDTLLYFMGARDAVLENAITYMGIVMWGIPFQLLSTGSIPLIRNRGHVLYAMMASIVGGLANVAGDGILVLILGWGPFGAGLATAMSQFLNFSLCMLFFLRKSQRMPLHMFKPVPRMVARTLSNGFAPFVLTLAPEVTTVALNIATGAHGGGTAQAALAIISYTGVSIQWMIQGVNDGSQPLISRYFGAGDLRTLRALRHTNFAFAVGVGLIGALVLFGFKSQFAWIFGVSEEAAGMYFRGIALFVLGLPLYGLSHAITSNFYAVESSKAASAIIAAETACIIVLSFALSSAFGLDGAWATPPATQLLLCVLALGLLAAQSGKIARRCAAQAEKRRANLQAGQQ